MIAAVRGENDARRIKGLLVLCFFSFFAVPDDSYLRLQVHSVEPVLPAELERLGAGEETAWGSPDRGWEFAWTALNGAVLKSPLRVSSAPWSCTWVEVHHLFVEVPE